MYFSGVEYILWSKYFKDTPFEYASIYGSLMFCLAVVDGVCVYLNMRIDGTVLLAEACLLNSVQLAASRPAQVQSSTKVKDMLVVENPDFLFQT